MFFIFRPLPIVDSKPHIEKGGLLALLCVARSSPTLCRVPGEGRPKVEAPSSSPEYSFRCYPPVRSLSDAPRRWCFGSSIIYPRAVSHDA